MKNILILIIALTGYSVFSQSDTIQTNENKIVAFDKYLNHVIDSCSIKECSFKFRTFKKMQVSIYHVPLSNTETVNDILENDKVLRKLGTSAKAVARMDALSKSIKFDSKKGINELRRIFNLLADSKLYFADSIYIGIERLGMLNPDTNTAAFKLQMGYMHNFNSVQYLWILMKSWLELNSMSEMDQDYILLKEKMEILSDRLIEVTKGSYYKFAITDISKEKVKDISFSTQNDMFVDFNRLDFNQDMGYTGGLHLSFSTDFLKMRLFPYFNGDHILSYQKFATGFDVYTPYLRDTIQDLKAISYQHDRPFASTFYFGRTKYRLHKKGYLRHTGEFDLMVIRSQIGRYFQELLHKDFTVSSIKPVGWDHQISNGGRLGATIHHKFDFLLLSENASIFNGRKCAGMKFLNPYLSAEGQLSHEKTFIAAAATISSRDFYNSSGNHTDFKLKQLQKLRFDYSLGLQLSYVFHNSLLGDFGITKRIDDDIYDDEFLSTYYLPENLIVKWVWKVSGQINYHYRNTTLFYSFNLQKKEFREQPLYDVGNQAYKNILENRFDYTVYGWGAFGLIFNLR